MGSTGRGKRFWIFNVVGVLGFGIQLGALALLFSAGVHYLAATAFAVEAAVLHNFLWHERWTWRDRPATGRARLIRLWRFHALNGAVSMAGNLALMRLLVGAAALPVIPANLLAVLACAAVNFIASDRAIFRIPDSDSGFRIQDSGFRIQDSGFRIQDERFRMSDQG